MSNPLRVALVHDWLTGYRGGEKVLEAICEVFPDAPLYTLVHIRGSVPPVIENRKIHTSFINWLPLGQKKYRHYLPLFPLAAETLVDREFDLIISTSHAVAKSVRVGKAKHWCYIHSPMRYVWDRFDDYFGVTRVGWLASKVFFEPIAWLLRMYDRQTARRVTTYVANSQFVAQRVHDFYGRAAEVLHPPVDVEKFADSVRKPKDFYLFFSALVPYKRADLAIAACQKLGRRLIVVGDGPELETLRDLADAKWVTFLERVPDSKLRELYAEARALIFPAVEDFGIIPVEALAAGLPVIGLRAGGLLDSQTEETCQFFDSQTVDALTEAILIFEEKIGKIPSSFEPRLLRQQALKFSKTVFVEGLKKSLKSCEPRLNL